MRCGECRFHAGTGTHALHYVAKSKGGRGKKGGLSEYAERLGKSDSRIGEYRQAAKVVETINLPDVGRVLDKAAHLSAIHKLPEAARSGVTGWRRNRFRACGGEEHRAGVDRTASVKSVWDLYLTFRPVSQPIG